MLELDSIAVHYGMIEGLRDVSLKVGKGQVVSLIGANGAGKSSLLNAISGVVPTSAGSIRFEGRALEKLGAEQIVEMGVIQVPEGRQVFARMSVLENLRMGAYSRRKSFAVSDMDPVFALFPRLAERRTQLAGLMSGGEQQMLAIGRALMARPKLLLLDEPSMGLAPLVVKMIFSVLRTLNAQGMSILLVEQNAKAALKLSDYSYVLTTGSLSREGLSSELLDDAEVNEAFLGKRVATAGATPVPAPSTTH
jgi:branched-chain amino acid transport system ATP-binding protein